MTAGPGLTAEQLDRRMQGRCDVCGGFGTGAGPEPSPGRLAAELDAITRTPWGLAYCDRCAGRRVGWGSA